MELAERAPALPLSSHIRSYDGWIVFGYAIFSIVVVIAICFAAGGTAADTELAIAAAMM